MRMSEQRLRALAMNTSGYPDSELRDLAREVEWLRYRTVYEMGDLASPESMFLVGPPPDVTQRCRITRSPR